MKYFEPIDGVKILSNCPVCNSRFHSDEIQVIEEKTNAHLLHIQCKKCKSCLVAVVFANSMGVNSITLVTDLMRQDVVKFMSKKPVSLNDVIDLHIALSQNDVALDNYLELRNDNNGV